MDNYLPIGEASQRVKLPIQDLNHLALLGKIKSIMLHGQILLRESDVMACQAPGSYPELEGHPIGIGEASRKYNVAQPTISRWIQKGYIHRIDQQGQKILVNEADVARMAAYYASRPGRGRRTDIDLQK